MNRINLHRITYTNTFSAALNKEVDTCDIQKQTLAGINPQYILSVKVS